MRPVEATRTAIKKAKWLARQVGLRAAAPVAETFGPSKWLMDTGCGFDFVSRSDIPRSLESLVTERQSPVVLRTANGVTSVTQEATLQVTPLLEVVKPLLLESTP